MLQNNKIIVYEIIGTIFIIILGSALHFTYEISGKLSFVGAFSAVNESVWEHLKLAFFPSLVWMLIEYLPLKKQANNFFTAKMLGTYLMVTVIPIVFYSYTAFSGESIFAIDISTFIVAVIIGQILGYKLLTLQQLNQILNKIAIAAIIVLALAFIIFTFYPPNIEIFRDPGTGKYGIP
jgi:hypothetical protein